MILEAVGGKQMLKVTGVDPASWSRYKRKKKILTKRDNIMKREKKTRKTLVS